MRTTTSISTAREYFDALRTVAPISRLRDAEGTWEFEIDGAGSWAVRVDHGRLEVVDGVVPDPTARFRFTEPEFVRLATGEGHENLITAAIRGAMLDFDGDIRFAQKAQCFIPLAENFERRPA